MTRFGFIAILLAAVIICAVPAFALAQDAGGQNIPGAGANYETRLSGLEEEMRNLNGQLEQLQYSIRRIDQNTQRMQADTDARLTRLETAMAAQQQQAATPPVQLPTQTPVVIPTTAPPLTVIQTPQPTQNAVADAPVNGTLGAVKMRDGRVTGAIDNPQSPPLPQVPADYGLTPQEQYDHAFGLLRQADYDGAEKAFKAFIDKNPKDKLVDNAKYWYGETIYVRGRFDEAAVAFADAYQQNPGGSKAPDSLLKLAMSLAAIDKTADACTSLTELRAKFPNANSSVRARAQEQRVKLKCGG